MREREKNEIEVERRSVMKVWSRGEMKGKEMLKFMKGKKEKEEVERWSGRRGRARREKKGKMVEKVRKQVGEIIGICK